jgi:hypothetical protein
MQRDARRAPMQGANEHEIMVPHVANGEHAVIMKPVQHREHVVPPNAEARPWPAAKCVRAIKLRTMIICCQRCRGVAC